MCTTCNVALNVAESPQADRQRAFIRGLIARGPRQGAGQGRARRRVRPGRPRAARLRRLRAHRLRDPLRPPRAARRRPRAAAAELAPTLATGHRRRGGTDALRRRRAAPRRRPGTATPDGRRPEGRSEQEAPERAGGAEGAAGPERAEAGQLGGPQGRSEPEGPGGPQGRSEPEGPERAGGSRYIESGALTPSSPSERAIVRCAATPSARRKDSTPSPSAPSTWQSR